MACGFWLDVLKTLIGTFAGAFLGFGSALLVQHFQRRRDDLAAGNLAVFTLAQQLNGFLVVKKGFNEEREKIAVATANYPQWASSKPILFEFSFNDSLRFDFRKLGFLAPIDHTVLERLALVEKCYIGLAASIKQHADAFREIQRRMAELYKKGEVVTLGALEDALGGNLVANADTLVAALIEHFAGDEPSYREVGASLTAALKRHFGEKTIFGKKRTILGLAPARNEGKVGAI